MRQMVAVQMHFARILAVCAGLGLVPLELSLVGLLLTLNECGCWVSVGVDPKPSVYP